MKELRTILNEYDKIDFTVRKAAIATVVQVRGSSYRSPGARMLITDDGRWVGSISGGCLEGDALRKARHVMSTGESIRVTYDTREESNQKLGVSLGCNGVIDVIIEPAGPEHRKTLELFKEIVKRNALLLLATITKGKHGMGEKLLINEEAKLEIPFANAELSRNILTDAGSVFEQRRCETRTYCINDQEVEVFLEIIQPSVSLILFGAGFDARPVSQLAKSLGWNVTVTDECVAHIAPVFFPFADKLSLCERSFVDRDFEITPQTACVLMSHNYEYDRDVLKKLLQTPAPYIGVLGPRKRFERIIAEFNGTEAEINPKDMDRIHSPIGLDIGAETPDEIALSIIAEIQSKFSQRSGGFLKYRRGPIHQRDKLTDQVFRHIYLAEPNLKQASSE